VRTPTRRTSTLFVASVFVNRVIGQFGPGERSRENHFHNLIPLSENKAGSDADPAARESQGPRRPAVADVHRRNGDD